MNQDIGQPNNEPNNIWKSIGFFNGEDHLTFTFKKTEKITSALYLISSLLKDTEPIKWELREKGISLLSSAISMNALEPRDKNNDIHAFFSVSLETLSILRVGHVAGLVSEMNHSILKNEIEEIVFLLKTKVFEDAARAGYVLSDSFFKTENSRTEEIPLQSPSLFSRTQNNNHSEGSISNKVSKNEIKTGKNITQPKIAIKDKKDSRKSAIIDLLKRQSPLTIKDFVKAISGCSEKTIQRELLDLVEKGIIKKEGERRWSTYSLK
jgi:DNA-binding transcriptional ArsR family regulator